eukprot:TRINITY_DN14081_c0_g1_i2.p1 TRINITY_DN14081_c0_g1~~TRINITY_DN14081_c0_g1_i2.p1  ORF type:complete len:199 (+),score=43.59 TRINITY_DN14081_c0_g1_i2:66-662(+)
MMRLFKTFSEVKKILDIIRTKRNFHPYAKASMIFSRVCYGLYWFLDNISALTKSGFLRPSLKMQQVLLMAKMIIWFSGILSSFIYNSINLQVSYQRESDLKKTVLRNDQTPRTVLNTLNKISSDRILIMYNLVRNFSDLMVATREVKLDKIVLRTKFNNGIVGIFGMVSSTIAMLQLYRKEIEMQSPMPQIKRVMSYG